MEMTTEIFEMDFENGGLKPVQDSDLKVGQIFFLNGYGQDEYHHERKVVYQISKSGFDGRAQYNWVNLDKPVKGMCNAWEVKPIAQKFGIGLYYHPDQFATPEEITEALQLANEAEVNRDLADNLAKIEADVIREKGQKIIEANYPKQEPSGFIIATLMQDDSDSMSDYFASSVNRTVILAWTFKKRDDFNEMRKACLNTDIEGIRKYAVKPIVNGNGEEKTERNKDWWHPEDEHRENYSMGSGNYLGKSKYSGWIVKKVCFSNYYKINSYYHAAGLNGGFYAFKPEEKQAEETEPVKIEGLEIIDYSDKAFAVFGETKAIKDKLLELGGRFNSFLTNPKTNQKQAGWIFSKKLKDKVKQALSIE